MSNSATITPKQEPAVVNQNTWLLIAGLAAFKLLLHLLTNTNYEFHRDELLYWALSNHLDWGYFSVPPAIAGWLAALRPLIGDSVFAVRLLPALFGAASVVIIGLLVREFGGKAWAIVLASAAFIVSPAFLRTNTMYQPVFFNQFYWLLSMFLMVKLLNSRSPKYLVFIGLLWGWAFLNKYSIVFLAAGLLAGLLLTPQRNLLQHRNSIFAAIAGLLIISPNIFWQHANGWPVFAHFQMLQESQFANVQISEFFLMQLLMNAHALLLWLAGLVFLLFTKSGKKYRAIGFGIVALFAILIAIKGKAYYTLGIYPALFAAGGAAVEQFATQKWRWVNPLLLGLMLLSALPLVPFGLPVLGQNAMIKHAKWSQFMGTAEALRWEDGKMHDLPQDYADMIGWREIGNLGIAAWQKLTPAERDSAIIYTENYGQAGAIWYYGRPENLPQPISFSDNYLFWVPEKIQFNTFIYVNDELGEDIQQMFGNIELAGSLDKPLARENGVQVYICRDPKPEFLEYAAGIAKRIKQSLHH
ncbi:MAG: glycosyltransferase family 39 protein [Calditrichia bacterium]